jgi:hypothetical protein
MKIEKEKFSSLREEDDDDEKKENFCVRVE